MHLLRIDAPVIRHAFWRLVLVTCLALPVLQPWRSSAIDPSVARMEELDAELPTGLGAASTLSASSPVLARVSTHIRANWRSYVGMFLAIGAILRLAWLLIGIHGLQRLRRSGERAPNDDEYDELAALIEAGAEIRRVPRLGQPVTFGVLKPAVLLPASFSALPAGVQRAVLAHELWHVRRRDWAWVLVEEGICALFWFNPAMWWLVSRVQSSREEVVDELTVQLTNARKTYMEALLAFADQPTLYPATPFARRRHLFHRMVLISTEAAMSSRRIIGSSVAMAAVLLATGLYASSRFPLKAEATLLVSSPGQTSQNPPRDRRPGEAGPESSRERDLKKAIEADPSKIDLYLQLARLQESRGARRDAEATMLALQRSAAKDPAAAGAVAGFYARDGQFERAVETLEAAATANPSNAGDSTTHRRLLLGKGVQGPVALFRTEAALPRFGPCSLESGAFGSSGLLRRARLQEHPSAHEGQPRNRPSRQTGDACGGRCAAQPGDGAQEDDRAGRDGVRASIGSTATTTATPSATGRARRRTGAAPCRREHQATDQGQGRQTDLPR